MNDGSTRFTFPFLLLCVLLLLLGVALSVLVGARSIPTNDVLQAFTRFEHSNLDHLIVRDMRLPRALACALSGMGLAVAGAVMQGVIRNPIAGPSLLGLGSGASLSQVLALILAPGLLGLMRIETAILGAFLGASLVFGFAATSRSLVTPAKLALIGVNVSILLAAFANGLILHLDLSQETVSWFSRGMQGIGWFDVLHSLPWIGVGLTGAFIIARDLNILSLGDSAATGLGLRIQWVRIIGAGSVIALAGTAFTFVGPVAFVGVLVPHAARAWVGLDYRRVILGSGILGATFLLYADSLARVLEQNLASPLPVSLLCALIGAPGFLILVGRRSSIRAMGIA